MVNETRIYAFDFLYFYCVAWELGGWDHEIDPRLGVQGFQTSSMDRDGKEELAIGRGIRDKGSDLKIGHHHEKELKVENCLFCRASARGLLIVSDPGDDGQACPADDQKDCRQHPRNHSGEGPCCDQREEDRPGVGRAAPYQRRGH